MINLAVVNLSIKTQIKYYDIPLIKSSIVFEINRGGQVFFVHNNVKSIHDIVVMLKLHLPGVIIEPAHGQEPKRQLEQTMNKFIEGNSEGHFFSNLAEIGFIINRKRT